MNSRRKFLLGLTSLGGIGVISSLNTFTDIPLTALLSSQQQWLVSCGKDRQGNFFVAAFDLSGKLISQIPLPARGHDVIAMPSKPGHAVVFARRPGQFIFEVDFRQGSIIKRVNVGLERRLYGHGVLIDNDGLLLTTENDYQLARGLIVVRDTTNYQVVGQYDSGGVGPHQLAVMPNSNGKQIVIANGGIQTHPEHGRKKLNLATMQPNLAYMSLPSGQIDDTFELANKHLSIRHLDVSSSGKVVAGLQYQGRPNDEVPLAISHHGEAQLSALNAEQSTWRSMKHYTSSVCINSDNNTVAITCPRANLVTYWQLNSGDFMASYKIKDGAGVTLIADNFIVSTGRGRIVSQQEPMQGYSIRGDFEPLQWDNHMNAILA
jgi:hypothetical protein